MAKAKTFNWAEYYSAHRDIINARRRDRYKTDEAYREKIQRTMRDYSRAHSGANTEKRRIFREAMIARWTAAGLLEREITRRKQILGRPAMPIMVDFGGMVHPLYPISVLGAEAGFFSRTIRHWENLGVLPPASFRDKRDRRWYSEKYIDILRRAITVVTSAESRWSPDRLKQELERLWDEEIGGWTNEQAFLAKRP